MKFIITLVLLPMLGLVSIMNISARSLSSDLKALAQNGQYRMMLCAHRGNTAAGVVDDVPESSLEALDLAVAKGIDMIEIDARITKDSVIVNLHDPYIDAMTNGTGVLGAMTYNELLKYRLLTPSGEDSDEPVHTFKEMLEAAKDRIYVFVDIKVTGIARKMFDIVRELDMLDQVAWYVSTSTKAEADAIYSYDDRAIICPYVSTASKLKSYDKLYDLSIAHTSTEKMETADNLLTTFSTREIIPYANHLEADAQIFPSENPDYTYLERMIGQNIRFIQSDVCDMIAAYAVEKGYREENVSSVEKVCRNNTAIQTKYYDFMGIEYTRPLPGRWMIKKTIYDDGLSDTEICLCR